MLVTKKARDKSFDILKGIGILIMIIGHATWGGGTVNLIFGITPFICHCFILFQAIFLRKLIFWSC